jgi:hypothetical protein
MKQPLEGINEKIKRSNECICNLDGEIKTFFDQSDYSVIPNQDDEMFQVVADYHLGRPIPLRFSVLAGEIVHHLRSSLDHLIWQLSSSEKQIRDPTGIEFPIFDVEPIRKDELSRYERKVEGVSDANAKTLIKGFQPYSAFRPNPQHSPLFIIHEMDRFDKHRELTLFYRVLGRKLGPEGMRAFMKYKQAESPGTLIEYERAVKVDSKITPHVAFRHFAGREFESVIPGLRELVSYTEFVIEQFGRFFK